MPFIEILKKRWVLVAALLLSSLLKIWLLLKDVVPFNSDEAVVALMARHILAGEKPIFFYGQAYMGSLDAWLVAAGFALFGEKIWVIRFIQILLYLLVILTTAILGEKIFGSNRVGDLAALFMAIPAVNVTLYTTASLGGYGEALLIGNLLLLLSIQIVSKIQKGAEFNPWQFLVWGFLAGIGFWSIALTLVYSAAAGLYLLWGLWRFIDNSQRKPRLFSAIGLLMIGGILGASPWLIYAWQNGPGQLIYALLGKGSVGFEQLPWLLRIGQHILSFLLFGVTVIFGFRPPWEIRWLVLPLIPLILVFWTGVVVFTVRLIKQRSEQLPRQLLLTGLIALLILIFVFSPFGSDPSGRYFLPLTVPLAILAAGFISSLKSEIGVWRWALAGLLLTFHLLGTIQSAYRYPPGITTQFTIPSQVDHRYDQVLMDFLVENGETRGYSNYWVTYPLAFLSQEKLIFIPRLPYHPDFRYSERDDRYSFYGTLVADADRVAYITTNHPDLDAYLISAFQDRAVDWDEIHIGDYHVFYNLSEPVRPEEIGLGRSNLP